MSDQEKSVVELERQKLQDDIQRIKLALQIEGGIDESDEDSRETGSANLFIDTDCEDLENVELSEQPSTSRHDYEKFEGMDEEDGVGDEPGMVDMQLEDVEQLSANAENCLALNRAYQEVLMDMLRQVEESLVVNREKQRILEDSNNRESGTKDREKDPGKRKLVFMYAIPYFKDAEGYYPPVNEDVKAKKMLKEHKQDVTIASQWQSHQRKSLLSAVRIDALEKLLRGPMNRLEILHEKLAVADNGTDEKAKLLDSISSLEEHISDLKTTPAETLLLNVDPDKVDWMKISNRTFQGKRDTISCQYMWQNVINPAINRDSWSENEEKHLTDLVTKYDGKYWKNVAKELGTSRTAFQCLQHYQQHLNPAAINRSEWTPEEDELLSEVVDSCRSGSRISWNQVAYYIEGRSAHQCFTRWIQTDPAMRRGKWSEEEDCMLMASVHLLGTHDWTRIRLLVHGRSAAQCRERYCNSLDPALIEKPSKWTYEEDKRLLELVEEYGHGNWSKISTKLHGRTDNNILHRYRRLQEWQKRSDWLENQPKEVQEEMIGVPLDDYNERLVENFHIRQKKLMKKNAEVKGKPTEDQSHNNEEDMNMLDEDNRVEMHDYFKQKQDKQLGGLVVPRPPLRGYSSRSFMKMWERRVTLQKLIQAQIQRSLGQKHGMSDIQEIASSAVSNLENLRLLDSGHWGKLAGYLKHKKPCEISVKQILDWSKRFVTEKVKNVVHKPEKKEKKKSVLPALMTRVDNQLRMIIEMKSADILSSRRKRKGRPRRLNIFSDETVSSDDEKEIAVSTLGLLMKALSVDINMILRNAEARRVTEHGDSSCLDDNSDDEALEMLQTLVERRTSEQSESGGRNEISKYMTAGNETIINMKHIEETVQPSSIVYPAKKVMVLKQFPSDMDSSSSDQDSVRVLSYTEIDSNNSGTPPRVVNDETSQQKTTPKVIPQIPFSQLAKRVPQIFPNSRSTAQSEKVNDGKNQPSTSNIVLVKPTEEQLKKMKEYQEKLESGEISHAKIPKKAKKKNVENKKIVEKKKTVNKLQPKKKKPSQDASEPKNVNQTPTVSEPQSVKQLRTFNKPLTVRPLAVNHSQTAHIQRKLYTPGMLMTPTERPFIKKKKVLPFLPPNVTSLVAFKILLLQRRLMIANAGSSYNPLLYKGTKVKKNASTPREDYGQISSELVTLKESSTIAGELVSESPKGKNVTNEQSSKVTPNADVQNKNNFVSIQESDEYIMLRARFQALFSWPALLSTIYPPESCLQSQMNEKPKKFKYPDEVDDVEDSVRKAASHLFKEDKNGKKKRKYYKRKRYPCTGGKMFYRNLGRSREWKESVQEKRLHSRAKNILIHRGLLPVVEPEMPVETEQIKEHVNVEMQETKNVEDETCPAEPKKRKRGRPRGTKTKKKPKDTAEMRRTSERISTRRCRPVATATLQPVTKVKPSKEIDNNSSSEVEDIETFFSNLKEPSNEEEILAEYNTQTVTPACTEQLSQTITIENIELNQSDLSVNTIFEQSMDQQATIENIELNRPDLSINTTFEQSDEQRNMTIAMPLFRLEIDSSVNNQMQTDEETNDES